MIGIRIRDVDGAVHELAITSGMFGSADHVDEWIDLRHLWSVPGLADSHAHLAATTIDAMLEGTEDTEATIAANARAQLRGGVLLIADKGGRTDAGVWALGLGDEDAPEVHVAGRVLAPSDGYYPSFGIDINGSDLPEAVEAACRTDASWVKLIGDWPRKGVGAIPNYAEDELRSAVAVAHAHGRRVAIHTAAPDTPSMAVAAGIDSIEHGLFLTDDDVGALGARGGAWVPTLAAMGAIADMLGPDSSGGRLLADGLANATRLLEAAVAAGVAVLAGSDLHLPHGDIAAEACTLFESGLSAADTLATVTTAAYNYFRSARGFHPGATADLVGFARNPLDDIAALHDPEVVLRRGTFVTR